MNTFRLTQISLGKNLYLLPNANGCNIGLTPFGEAVNWECVDDPRYNPDDDITYVHSNATNILYDLFNVENHTTETGTINHVQVFARAKSNLYAPDPTATFKIILDDSNCTDTQKSNSFNLVTTYSKYSHVWTTNPYRGGAAFEWSDIDAYQYGVECSSPTIIGENINLTLRPNALGSLNELTAFGDATNWECVDEAVSDDDTTYNYTAVYGLEKIDMYNIPNHTTETGTINSVTVFTVAKRTGSNGLMRINQWVKSGGTWDAGTMEELTGVWTTYTTIWALDPNTGAAWAWAAIDALEIGGSLSKKPEAAVEDEGRITQVYAVVNYTEDINPDLRTTQCYMKVNYDETVTCDLNVPEEISQDYAQNIKMLNFWSGNRSVYGLARSKDTTVMQGYEIEDSDCTDACARLKCVEELGKQGNSVTLTGFSYSDYNDEYQILSWGWKKVSSKPVHYAWILELERTT